MSSESFGTKTTRNRSFQAALPQFGKRCPRWPNATQHNKWHAKAPLVGSCSTHSLAQCTPIATKKYNFPHHKFKPNLHNTRLLLACFQQHGDFVLRLHHNVHAKKVKAKKGGGGGKSHSLSSKVINSRFSSCFFSEQPTSACASLCAA